MFWTEEYLNLKDYNKLLFITKRKVPPLLGLWDSLWSKGILWDKGRQTIPVLLKMQYAKVLHTGRNLRAEHIHSLRLAHGSSHQQCPPGLPCSALRVFTLKIQEWEWCWEYH